MIDTVTYNCRISLRPLDYFFFGGEETFGSGDQQSYFAKTRPFPQQTTILGLLRHYGHENHLGAGKGVDIGQSFKPDCLAVKKPFGYIRRISPLFLTFRGEAGICDYLPGALSSKGSPMDVFETSDSIKQWRGGDWIATRQVFDYKAKDGYKQWLVKGVGYEGMEKYVQIEEVVKVFDKIGITKAVDGEDQKDGFYKQRMARLEKGWAFSVLADLSEEQLEKMPGHAILPFGAEKALFHISIEKQEKKISLADLFPDALWEHSFPEEDGCVLLLSDALVNQGIYDHCRFAVSDVLDFRSIYTPSSVKEFARFNQYGEYADLGEVDRLSKSAKYNLLKRGSLLYGDAVALSKALDKRPYYQLIGYNHYTIISPSLKPENL